MSVRIQFVISKMWELKVKRNLIKFVCTRTVCYIHNIFTIFLQQILSGRLLLVVIVGIKK